jgi:hypothetical protein
MYMVGNELSDTSGIALVTIITVTVLLLMQVSDAAK